MKTLKTFFITVLFTASIFYSNANEYNETTLDIKSINDLTVSIKQLICSDFAQLNNYFYQHEIAKLKEDVIVTFYINSDNYIKILTVESEDKTAEEYLNQLLDGKKMKTDNSALNKKFKLKIKLDYRT